MTDKISEATGGAGITLLNNLRFNNNLQVPASYIVFTDGTTVYALNGATGRIDHHDTDAATVIKHTIASYSKVVLKSGTYTIREPLEMVNFFTLELEAGAILQVPNGYSRYVFGFGNGCRNAHLVGGIIREIGVARRLWQGIRVYSSKGDGIFFNTVRDIWIAKPDIAIKIQLDGKRGFINGNEFKSIRIVEPNIFIDFDVSLSRKSGIDSNYFEDILGQADTLNTTHGARNIRYNANIFIDVKFWDLKRTDAISASIHKDASNTFVLGGFMTHKNFEDNGKETQVIDQNRTSFNDVIVRSSFTPTGTADLRGDAGALAWDNDYIYVKTSIGWKRAALNTW